ncbi:glutamate ABC transporter substrate-binding protein [Couchioplanes azureus]|uniref:glutamate ABC transporter substrate-binding protein n=1 Tax=Couchioplanes caeruleus TaxID=56438 RepID=UPI0016714312|nr:glutamate ABC transporter substrate-binding protein [Couchioplanes caeruleus]GGQ58933.1 glutamate-binding protein [Couchioplanes caeruleus subsp. azureus]
MRKTRAAVAAVALTLALATAACGGDDAGSTGERTSFPAGSTMQKLRDAQKLRVGTKFDQPGFGLKRPSGTPKGFDVEIAKIIAERLGIAEERIEYTETPSSIREQVLQQDKVDIVVATYTITDKRKQLVDFAGPYYIAGQTLMVNADYSEITGPDSFKDPTKKVCSVTNSTPATNIQKYLKDKTKQLVLFENYDKCVKALMNRKVDAVTSDNVILLGFIATNEGKLALAGTAFTEEPYGIGVKKGDDQFRNFINDTIEASFGDGSYRRAWKYTAGKYDQSGPTIPTIDRY